MASEFFFNVYQDLTDGKTYQGRSVASRAATEQPVLAMHPSRRLYRVRVIYKGLGHYVGLDRRKPDLQEVL